ncbi:alkylphosphonate utilization protein [Candidatus Gracilibacteria bacterium]|nr:alkylphosphonate utilization protein [Candidatus Gracilibacteria bacterium]
MSEELITVDAFGNTLSSGDTVQLTQQLDVRGTKISLNKGTKVKNIRLTDDIEEISANTPEIKGLVLKTCFMKKVD